MSDGALLTVVALVLVVVIVGLFRLVAVLDAAELSLRKLVAGVWAARRAVETAAELAAAVERDAAGGQEAFDRLDELKRRRAVPPGSGGTGPVSLPLRPRPSSP